MDRQINYIFIGILQGIFEWLPVSSEGIVALAGNFLVKDINPIDLALFLHLGTLLAVLIFFKKDWINILNLKDKKTFRFLSISTIVSLAIGFPIYKLIHNFSLGNTLLILMGFGLLLTAYFQKKKIKINISDDSLAIVSGILQGLAVIPGLSRSGSTIFGLSLKKNNPSEILKISYIMSVPIILCSTAYIFIENNSVFFEAWPALIFSFISGFISLKALMNIAEKINFFKFVLAFSILCFIGAGINLLI